MLGKFLSSLILRYTLPLVNTCHYFPSFSSSEMLLWQGELSEKKVSAPWAVAVPCVTSYSFIFSGPVTGQRGVALHPIQDRQSQGCVV